MATIKSYTDIEQSRKLAEMLPIESADMIYTMTNGYHTPFIRIETIQEMDKDDVCAWSLAALLDVIKKYGLIDLRFLSSTFDGRGEHLMNVWCCTFDNIYTVSFDFYADNPVDACYRLIIKLNELKML